MEKTSYNKKYKDRDPKETIKIIKDFFESKGFTLVEDFVGPAVVSNSLWGSTISLKYKGFPVLTQRGKGTSKEFCLASGYAELYERFCGLDFFNNDFRIIHYIQQERYRYYGHYYNSDEKEFNSIEDLLIDDNFKACFKFEADWQAMILDHKFIGIPFTNLLSGVKNYYNPVLLRYVTGSNGMAAGNTLEEALVQGISELFERNAVDYLFQHIDEQYYNIDLNSISNQNLVVLLNTIQSTGKKINILDLSINTGFPCIFVILFDINTGNITYQCGCHPVFDIALERCLTEIYQDVLTDSRINIEQYISDTNFAKENHKCIDGLTIIETSHRPNNILDEEVLLNSKIIKLKYDIFLRPNQYSNEFLLDYYKKIIQKHNIQLFYYDYSLIPAIKAIQIYCQDFKPVGYSEWLLDNKSNNLFNKESLEKAYALYCSDSVDIYTYINTLFKGFNFLEPLNLDRKLNKILLDCIETKQSANFFNFSDLLVLYNYLLLSPVYSKDIAIYAILFKYRIAGYSKDEIKKIFIYMGFTFDETIWQDCINIQAILFKVLIPILNNTHIKDIQDLFKVFIDK